MAFQSTRLSRASTWTTGSLLPTLIISIHKALASLDIVTTINIIVIQISIHKALASLDHNHTIYHLKTIRISIHKALASLDSKIIQTCSTSPLTFYALCSSLPSSTNSVHSPSPLSQPFPLFFRCESPWHFMSAWHSHLV